MSRRIAAMMVGLALGVAGCGSAPEPKPAPKQNPSEKRPEAAPRPPAPTRAELTKRIEEVDQIHQEVISVLQQVQEAQTGQWARTRAGEAVKTAAMGRHQTARLLRRQLEEAKDSHLDRVEVRIRSRKGVAERELRHAKFKLKAAP